MNDERSQKALLCVLLCGVITWALVIVAIWGAFEAWHS